VHALSAAIVSHNAPCALCVVQVRMEEERQKQQRIAEGANDAVNTIARLEDEIARIRDGGDLA
jgi:hypothetical protein